MSNEKVSGLNINRARKEITDKKRYKLPVCVTLIIIIVALSVYLFFPFGQMNLSVYKHSSSEYYPAIKEIFDLEFTPSTFVNKFHELYAAVEAGIRDMLNLPERIIVEKEKYRDSHSSYNSSSDLIADGESVRYGNLIQKTDTHVFCLIDKTLKIYELDNGNYTTLEEINISTLGFRSAWDVDMYLSEDEKELIILGNDSDNALIVTLDISVPGAAKKARSVKLFGKYLSSAIVNGKLIVSSRYSSYSFTDFDDPKTFLPYVKYDNGITYISSDDIIVPDGITTSSYYIISVLDENTNIIGNKALLGFNGAKYVTGENIYLMRGYDEREFFPFSTKAYERNSKTDIVRLSYGNAINYEDTYTVSGDINDRSYVNENDGLLRVITENISSYVIPNGKGVSKKTAEKIKYGKTNKISLYVFDTESGDERVRLEDFIADGLNISSAKYTQDNAYIYTSDGSALLLDLSFYDKVTYTPVSGAADESETIISLGNGLSIEIIKDGRYIIINLVKTVAGQKTTLSELTYKANGIFKKSFLVDEEEKIFGFALDDYGSEQLYSTTDTYFVLSYKGDALSKISSFAVNTRKTGAVSFRQGDYLYVIGYDEIYSIKISQ